MGRAKTRSSSVRGGKGSSAASLSTAAVDAPQLIQIEATEELANKNPRETTSLFEKALIASANDVKRWTVIFYRYKILLLLKTLDEVEQIGNDDSDF